MVGLNDLIGLFQPMILLGRQNSTKVYFYIHTHTHSCFLLLIMSQSAILSDLFEHFGCLLIPIRVHSHFLPISEIPHYKSDFPAKVMAPLLSRCPVFYFLLPNTPHHTHADFLR